MNNALVRRSERLYDFVLQFYPKSYRQAFGEEMKYVFSESLKEAYAENGDQGVITLWGRTIIDAGKSLILQHIENQKERQSMQPKNTDIVMQNKVFTYIALATAAILAIPLIAMQFTSDVDWGPLDFTIIGVLLFGMGSLFVLTA